MKPAMSKPTIELWEAWVDLQCADESSKGTLFVWGELCVGQSLSEPILIKRTVQGADPAHLYLEVVPYILKRGGRITETRYSEPVQQVGQYTRIFICAGEEVLTEIKEIELLD
jgi:hypothetical protein